MQINCKLHVMLVAANVASGTGLNSVSCKYNNPKQYRDLSSLILLPCVYLHVISRCVYGMVTICTKQYLGFLILLNSLSL